ncbi:MAG: alpha/beta fold hydrolase [Myxococcota bacterium]
MKRTPGPIRIAYDTTGSGTAVVLIMGFSGPGRAWDAQIDLLSKQHQVIWFDNRGVGSSDAPRRLYSMRRMAADVANLLDHLGVEQAHVVGVSMGGMISQEFALQYRHRVRSLCLIATHHGGPRSWFAKPQGLKLFLQTHTSPPRSRYEALERLLYTDEYLRSNDPDEVRETLKLNFGNPAPSWSRFAQAVAVLRHNTAPRLHQLSGVPTLVVKPVEDILIRPSHSDRLAQLIPGARLVPIAGGHGLVRECADELSALLLEHFAVADQNEG